MEELIRADKLLAIGAAFIIIKEFINYISKKLKNDSDKESNINDILVKQLKDLSEKSLNYSDELSEVKKLILNQSNMSTCDFQIYIKNLNNLIYFHLINDFYEIIDNNNISEKNLEITIQKTKNITEKVFSTHLYELYSLQFDKAILNDIIRMMKQEQENLEVKIQSVITEYSENNNSPEYENDAAIEAKKNIKEILNFMNNNLSSHSYNILNGLNLCECS